ncbi:hypothetical protein PT287_08240 [Lactobacillus sp. ESL0679]|uniref:hypothetical protein n=1 Tax=Lactobacillus sp. ESL0679 TaxID=2983209 RepID=UPI0023F80BEC|nr:hypothetical protein [Lactobacillus sp. ESL0679]MDF7683486.1 hypothetical protein [Lactobacillus sp. ESL0679]
MVEEALIKSSEEIKEKFQDAIRHRHLTQRKVAKYCDTNEFQFSRAIAGENTKRANEIRHAAADLLGIEI